MSIHTIYPVFCLSTTNLASYCQKSEFWIKFSKKADSLIRFKIFFLPLTWKQINHKINKKKINWLKCNNGNAINKLFSYIYYEVIFILTKINQRPSSSSTDRLFAVTVLNYFLYPSSMSIIINCTIFHIFSKKTLQWFYVWIFF